MKKKLKLFRTIICILSLFWACQTNKTADFEIVNKSESIIDSIKISCSGTDYKRKSLIYKLLPSESFNVILDMNNIKKIDGNYFIEVFKNKPLWTGSP